MTIDATTPPATKSTITRWVYSSHRLKKQQVGELVPEMKLRQLRSRSQVVGMTISAVRIANKTWASTVKSPIVRCALGNNFDRLSPSNIRYSMQQACMERLAAVIGPVNMLMNQSRKNSHELQQCSS
jgi:hypothetical protein